LDHAAAPPLFQKEIRQMIFKRSHHTALAFVSATAVLTAGLALTVGAQRAAPVPDIPWLSMGGTADNARYVQASQITKANVNQLQVVWNYPHGDTVFNPVVVRGKVYGRARGGSLVALDAKTGKELWIRTDMGSMTTRGLNYWSNADGSDERLIFAMNDYLQEIDAKTGKSILTFGTNGVVDLREGLGRDPATVGRIQSGTPGEVFENLILLGSATGEGYFSPPGDLRAYDILTGKLVWQFHTVPHPGEFGYETWPKDAYKYIGGVNTWGELSVDAARGIAYFPTGSPTYDYYGADRPGMNLFSSALVALDARTGKRLWHFQVAHHDLWDFDNNAAPQLTTIRHNGRNVDVVALAGKTGFLYVFDRVTGEPMWPIEERPVPKSPMPGEQSWPTQPFPTKPEPFAKQTFTEADINPYGNVTDEAREAFRARLKKTFNLGFFTPITHEDTLHIPGSNGGALFGTTAAGPDGSVYVITQDNPAILRLLREGESARGGGAGAGTPVLPGAAIYATHCQVCHGPNRVGTAEGPALLDLAGRMDQDAIAAVMLNGKGRMPAFPQINSVDMALLSTYLMSPAPGGRGGGGGGGGGRGRGAASGPPPPPELVVGSGSAVPRAPGGGGRGAGPRAYPEGVPQTPQFVINAYGTFTWMSKPPYTTIVKYNLNEPKIVWRVGLGDDSRLAALGIHDTGVPQMRNSLVVTSTGLLFAVGADNKIRAYDTDTGKVLWAADVPGTFRGGPAMYALDGRQYLLIPAGANPNAPVAQAGPLTPAPPAPPPAANAPMGYLAFALPDGR
jgi:quinoprotein glucose dehydrogenase